MKQEISPRPQSMVQGADSQAGVQELLPMCAPVLYGGETAKLGRPARPNLLQRASRPDQ
ncbi:MAG TPA: hypothetical protein VG405_04180 [Solirubrobacteraceae bacterium]|nr:hypothetical protein [Solirubrobacteraceae bacterium]